MEQSHIKCETDCDVIVKAEPIEFEEGTAQALCTTEMKTDDTNNMTEQNCVIKLEPIIEGSREECQQKENMLRIEIKCETDSISGVTVKTEPVEDDFEGTAQALCVTELRIDDPVTNNVSDETDPLNEDKRKVRKKEKRIQSEDNKVKKRKPRRIKRTNEKRYECKICHRYLSGISSLKAHNRTHTGEKPYECNVCSNRFSQKAHLEMHVRIHTGGKPYECNICHTRFTQKINLQRHFRSHNGEKPFECNICLNRFTRKSALLRHSILHNSYQRYARQIVAKVYDFMKKEAIKKYAEKLTDARWRTAQAIGISETTVTRILRERRANKLSECSISDSEEEVQDGNQESTSTDINLESSQLSSTSSNNHKCEIELPDIAIKTEPNVEEVAGPRANEIKLEKESDITVQCIVKVEPTNEEEGKFSNQEGEGEKRTEVESSSNNTNTQSKDKREKLCTLKPDLTHYGGEKPYRCNVCEHRFSQKYKMIIHYRTHTGEKPLQCDVCHKRFSEHSSFIVHSRTHTGEKPYQCDVCQKRFSIHANLVKHIRIHTGLKPYECAICKSRFTQKGHLQGHLKTHTGEKPYECNVCNKRFVSNSRLKSHSRQHTGEKPASSGEKPYECNICHSRFKMSRGLKAHIRTHTGEKPYECDICHKRCSQKGNLRTHIKSHSGEKYHTCHICKTGFTRNFTLQKHLRLHLL
ncbi:zinc finger protein ZFP2-like [Plodia interpunctella]|uniref:zinc finger protein ZFP2-like n=1 Tax=Plodia interpunctella TaxID=58824 RepID=UPI0023675BD9|nr:zinc finger protein ZFP2-like [Plodia interpunctella]